MEHFCRASGFSGVEKEKAVKQPKCLFGVLGIAIQETKSGQKLKCAQNCKRGVQIERGKTHEVT